MAQEAEFPTTDTTFGSWLPSFSGESSRKTQVNLLRHQIHSTHSTDKLPHFHYKLGTSNPGFCAFLFCFSISVLESNPKAVLKASDTAAVSTSCFCGCLHAGQHRLAHPTSLHKVYLHCTHPKLTAPIRPSVAPRAFGLAALPHPLYGALDGDKPWYLPSHKAKRAPAASSSVGRSQPTPTINEAFCFLKDKWKATTKVSYWVGITGSATAGNCAALL